MKFLLVFIAVLLLAWRWRAWRSAQVPLTPRKKADTLAPQTMVQCQQCGVHLPANDAVIGTRGAYCSIAHRQHMEP
ncbi:MAG: PP0621 family protein [Rhodoferax sp.]